ncbi:alpha/beta fold hydrolase [Ruficoccus amylovorans]|uniref:Alpha/beta fold hydrolase n=1 Tax=Ruficoccus amylovorans TaxID=1804625 RepID=A0A842HAK6_9BACT|nr:alpha/beta fold hydrolase [Ruficoccus amylovorans]MBC2593118.1 alpha/beta fold hydrolase [Ruficoccus amylovorans]
MKLAHRYFGGAGNEPLIILHGLLGSSRNWITIGRALAEDYEVFALDLRNHGDSPHADTTTFEEMAADVEETLLGLGLESAHLMGHSLGGKIAMHMAVNRPQRVRSLIVVDIAPKGYAAYHVGDFESMRALDLKSLTTRKEADTIMKATVPDFGQRQFLLTNLKRDADGKFVWGVNLEVLYRNLDLLRTNSIREDEVYTGPSRFILGQYSRFVRPEDHAIILKHFPNVRILTVPDCGHNPHIDQPKAFLEALQRPGA